MKKYTLIFAFAALMPVWGADAYEYTTSESRYYTSNQPVKSTSYYNRLGTNRRNIVTNNYYYSQPSTNSYKSSSRQVRSGRSYSGNAYTTNERYVANNERKTTVRETQTRTSQTRKYFLAHPFFQPLKGRFGSVTDFSYAQNSFNFDLLNGTVYGYNANGGLIGTVTGSIGDRGKQQTKQFVVKEDFSFGLTDTVALIGTLQYDKTKVAFKDWSVPSEPDNSRSDSGLNIFGIGLQYRFADDAKWIGMVDASFLHQKDSANMLFATIKGGYKIERTTIYGLGRLWYLNLTEGNAYGAYVDDNYDWLFLSYNNDVKDFFYAEAGLGLFSVLNKYFTLNGELVYGYYDWHNQLNIKGAIGWQPGDMFALNLYASTAIYDSAKGKVKNFTYYNGNPQYSGDFPSDVNGTPLLPDYTAALQTNGDYKIKDYNEWKIGVQAILYF